MKHILRIIALLLFLTTAYFMVRYNVHAPSFIFPICFGLSVILVVGTVCYFKFIKKQKIFAFLLVCMLATVCMNSSVFAASSEDTIDTNAKTLREKGGADLAEYDAIMSGAKEATQFDMDAYDAAHKVYTECEKLGITNNAASRFYKDCQDAKKYSDIAGKVTNKMSVGCSPVKTIVKNLLNKDKCWPCDATAMVISSIQKIASSSHNVLRTAALNLLAVFFLLWLAFVTLVYFGKFGFARVSEWLTNILNKAVLVLCIAMFLHAPVTEIYKYTVSPFIMFSADLAQTFSNEGRRAAKEEGSIVKTLTNIMSLGSGSGECKYCQNKGYNGTTAFLDTASVNSLLCMVCTVYHEVSPLIGLGQGIICFAGAAPTTNADNSMLGATNNFTLPKLGPLTIGIVLILSFSLVMILIAFYVILSVLQLGFVIILLPFYAMAFAFKTTREYTKNAWHLLMHAMMSLVALSIAVALVIVGLSSLLDSKMAISLGIAMMDDSSPTKMMDVFSGKDDFDKATESSSDSGFDVVGIAKNVILSELGISPFRAVMLLIVFCILAVRLINSAPEIIERLLDVWINRNADPQNMLTQGMQRTASGLSTTTKALIAGGSLAFAKKQSDQQKKKEEEERARRTAEQEGKKLADNIKDNAEKNTTNSTSK